MPQLVSVLPAPALEQIATFATRKREADICRKLTRYFLGKHIYNGVDIGEWIDVSVEHFRNQVGTDYLQPLNKLVSAGIVERDDRYQAGKTLPDGSYQTGQCKRFRLNPALFDSEPDFCKYTGERGKDFNNSPVIRQTVALLSRLKIDATPRAIRAYIADFVTRDFIAAKCKYNTHIPRDVYEFQGKTYHINTWLKIAKETGQTCILYRDRFYIADLEQFLDRHTNLTRAAYLDAALRVKHAKIRANITCDRNDTNYRLDTNLTNLPSSILPLIKLDGGKLVSIDLKNSQFTICAGLFYNLFKYLTRGEENFNNSIFAPQMLKCKNVEKSKEREGISGKDKEIYTINVTKVLRKNLCNCIENQRVIDEKKFAKSSAKHDVYALWLPLMDKISRLDLYAGLIAEKIGSDVEREILAAELEELKQVTASGKFYDHLQQKFTLATGSAATRDEVKKACFVAAFAAWRYNKAGKQVLKSAYPAFVGLMDSAKKRAIELFEAQGLENARDLGNADLAVTLQKIESYIFIDCILATLLNKGYRVFSKHDSILCRASDETAVKSEIEAILAAWFGESGFTLHIDRF